LESQHLYLEDENGHPIARGYTVIAHDLANTVTKVLPHKPGGFVRLKVGENRYEPRLVQDGHQWLFPSVEALQASGWEADGQYPVVTPRDLIAIPYGSWSGSPTQGAQR